ncbi:MAG: hypothetical protein GEU80_17115 [Dehalococcoidia bacterium]|nr:hypothetical protein [Dehalococcoidia bacterium]
MRDGVERGERRDHKRQRRWEVHGRSLQHVLNAIRQRGKAARRAEPSDDGAQARREALRERTRRRRR